MRTPAALLALAAVGVLAGCGSSSSSSTSNETAGTAKQASTAPSSSAASTNASGASLRVNGRPQFIPPPTSLPVQSGVVQVAYHYITIHPGPLRVKAGTTVRWTNYDPIQHTVTSEGGPQHFSQPLASGASFEVKLTRPGRIDYECTIHPATMNAVIEVL
ncbi:MAG TPA: plastocyanin/azurin family copper-binding protein [Solirubrobacteraceae bacterium]|jgi:plastocyanin|nr:plastocyanin/azurin family copper-binding protein [Solirubrobacteraceae bacterium]